jgi:hypothetical protein
MKTSISLGRAAYTCLHFVYFIQSLGTAKPLMTINPLQPAFWEKFGNCLGIQPPIVTEGPLRL